MDGSLYIVDALNFLFRAFHALPPLTNSKGIPTGAVYGLCTMLQRIEREQTPTHMCVVFDCAGKTFRDELYADYKANRPPMPPELSGQIDLSRQVVKAFGLPILCVDGFEADDVIATVARQAAAAGLRVVICSSDKDLMQLCDDRIAILDTMKNKLLGPAEVREKFGVPPERVGDVLALTGDSVDNVPGVPGIGPKTAADLVGKFGSLDELLSRVGEVKGKKGEAIAAHRKEIEISRQLVALRENVPLPVELTDLKRVEGDRDARLRLFREYEFTRLVAQEAAGAPAVTDETAPVAEPSAPPVQPTRPAELVLDRESLERLVVALRAAGRFGLAVLAEGAHGIRCGLVGLGFALPDERRFYVPVGHRLLGAPTTLREREALDLLAPVLGDQAIGKSVHDGKTIEVILSSRGVPFAGVASDALIGAYLLDASRSRYDLDVVALLEGVGEVAPRAAWLGSGKSARPAGELPLEDAGARLGAEAAAALALGDRQPAKLAAAGLDQLYQTLELPLSRVLARIECHGIRLDRDRLTALGGEVSGSIRALEAQIHELAGTTFNIGSPKQLAEVLFGKLQLPIVRRTKTGPSTDAEVLEELAAHHEVPAKIVEYRGLTKLKGTYIDALPALVDARTGRLHTSFNQAVAATGRLSSSDPNLQNIPIRTELGRRIREAFVADPGYHIVSADYSQIELRVLAHFSEDPAFLDAFRSGEDIHQRTAAEVFGVPTDQVTSEQRRVAKAINFGLVFGQSDFGLSQTLRIPRATAKAYIDSYFARYAGVKGYMERAIVEAREQGAVTTLLGRRRAIPELRASRPQERAHAERVARNTPIQGSAADLLKLAMIRVDAGLSRWPRARLLLTVHDELVFEVPEGEVTEFGAWVRREMEAVHQLRVPLVVDVGSGLTWGAAH
jgi:DNA polymerase-1